MKHKSNPNRISRNFLLMCMMLAIPAMARAQTGKVTMQGRLICADNNQGVPYATVSISLNDSIIGGTMCDSTGRFNLQKVPNGEVTLICNALGYIQLERAYTVNHAVAKRMDLDTLRMQFDAIAIEEVRVTGGNPFVQLKPNCKVVTLSNDDVTSGKQLTELLMRLPDFDGQIGDAPKLRGKPFKLLINGHPSGLGPNAMNTINLADIQSIEVITVPMAKYRAEGSGGIINIKMKRPSRGINAVFQANAGLNKVFNLSAAGNVRFKKINLFAGALGTLDIGENLLTAKHFDTAGMPTFDTKRTMHDHLMNISPKVGFDIYFNPNHTFTLFYNATRSNWPSDIEEKKHFQAPDSTILFNVNNEFTQIEHSVTGTYLAEFPSIEGELDISANLNHSSIPTNLTRITGGDLGSSQWQSRAPKEDDNSLYTSVDFYMPIIDQLELEAGLAADFTTFDNESGIEKRANASDPWAWDTATHHQYKALTQNLGAYVSLSSDLGPVSLRAGARYEHFDQKIEGALAGTTFENPKPYNDWFASGGISARPFESFAISASYSMRVDRPESYSLVPVRSNSDFSNEFYVGNPNLRSAYSHVAEASISQNWEKVALSADFSWTQINNDMETGFFRQADGTMLRMMVNLDYSRLLYCGGNLRWRIIPNLSTRIFGRATKIWQKPYSDAATRYSSTGYLSDAAKDVDGIWDWNLGCELTWDIPKIGYITVYGRYTNGAQRVYRKFASSIDLNALAVWNISKQWSLIVKMADILRRPYEYTTYNTTGTTIWNHYYNSRTLYLGVYYRIGKRFQTKSDEDVYTDIINMERMR